MLPVIILVVVVGVGNVEAVAGGVCDVVVAKRAVQINY